MKMKFGAIVVAGSGKIGGHVASKNKAGAYLRTKVTPSNPRTIYQSEVRSILSSLSTQWAELTGEQRLSWNSAVKDWASTDIFGDIKNPSGFNLFVKLNSNLVGAGGTAVLEAPAKQSLGNVVISSVIIDTTAGTLTIGLDGVPEVTAFKNILATPSISLGISNANNRFRKITSYVTIPTPAALYASYTARFGVPQVGGNVQVGFEVVGTNGQKSTRSLVTALVS